jgi:acyl-CoA reductase-like NAD-dependent aldehyde dehydrogenase
MRDALDNGVYKIWFARNYKAHSPNTVLLDNALATMGAGLPSAMAAHLVFPDRKVMAICGDGGFIAGDPKDESTFIGPMISEKEAERLESWITSAVEAGGKLICGGSRSGAMLDATLLEDVPKDQAICTHEAFGPVAVLSRFASFDEALREVNESAFGLQAGIFTRDLYKMQAAWDQLNVGGVVIGDVPSWRVDTMPYGGVKDSGLGRDGVRFAMEDMTEIRNLVIRTPDGR